MGLSFFQNKSVEYCIIFRVYEKENERKIKSYRVPGKVVNGFSSSNLTAHIDRDVSIATLRKNKGEEEEEEGENTKEDPKPSSDKPIDCDRSTIISTPQVKVEAFSTRNQFDRASQLRRSRKKRRKSDAGGANESHVSTSSQVSSLTQDCSRASSASLPQHEKMFSTSRAEYSSNYGNLI